MLADLYRNESLEASGDELDSLQLEMTALVHHWVDTVPDQAFVTWQIAGRKLDMPLLANLVGRAEGVFAAIRIARAVAGILIVS